MTKSSLPLILLVYLFISACVQNNVVQKPETLTGDYYPLKIGRVLYYQVDSVYFHLLGSEIIKDTVSWIAKENYYNTTRAIDGRLIYKIRRSIFKNNSKDTIPIHPVISWVEDEFNLRQAGNLPIIKMKKDISLKSTWDPNMYFDASSVEIIVKTNSIQPFSIPYHAQIIDMQERNYGGKKIDSVITVQLVDFDDNLIEKRYSIERYAEDIGLVEKVEWILNTQCRIMGGDPTKCQTLEWTDKAEAGYIMHKKIISWN